MDGYIGWMDRDPFAIQCCPRPSAGKYRRPSEKAKTREAN